VRIDRRRALTGARWQARAPVYSTERTRRIHIAGTAVQSGLIVGPSAPRATEYVYLADTMTERPSGDRQPRHRPIATAAEWVQRNQAKIGKHKGKWLAVSRSGIVASSGDFDTVFVQARQRGIDNPLVFKVPSSGRPKVVSAKR
jgi:hypothetical protein